MDPIKQFLSVSLPNLRSSFFNPKCFFIISNVIIVILVGESKLAGSHSSPTTMIYNEYVEKCQSLRRRWNQFDLQDEKKEGKTEMTQIDQGSENSPEENKHQEEEKHKEAEKTMDNDEGDDNGDNDDIEEKERDEEEELGLPTEELNRRVEDFIARVNRQRRLEAELLECGGVGEQRGWIQD
ncbi:unnamed protein product [Ilex paraguariensis]|uniref:DUF4408 domain-containing protein n=1 Tax=Ilex paraguariensis TaxID=185542 RepID=A0ABC8TV35_9AQUA